MTKGSHPPGPPGQLIRGNLRAFTEDRLTFFTDCARNYGDIVSFRLLHRSCLLVTHPTLIEEVLVAKARNFTKHFALRLNRLLLGNGLVTSEGDLWLRQRRLIQPAFLRDRIAAYGDIMKSAIQRMLAGWQPGETRDIHADMMHLTLEIVAQALFGADVAAEAQEVGVALGEALGAYVARLKTLFLFPEWIPTATHRRLHRSVRRLDEILYGIIDRQRKHGASRNNLLSLLLHVRDEDGSAMTDQQLRDEAMTLFLAGHETTALALAWAWYLLALNPEIEAKLAAEARRVLQGRLPTTADVPQLGFTARVLWEVLRLYPPVYAIGREAIHDCVLGGYRVRAGTTLLLSQWVVHRDPRFFANPEVFDPERWSSDPAHFQPRYCYFPFGGGPRICIGNTFALMEATMVLVAISQKFRLTLVPGHPVRPLAYMTLRPAHGIRVVLEQRGKDEPKEFD